MKLSVPAGFQRHDVRKTVCILAEDEADNLLSLGVGHVELLLGRSDVWRFEGRMTAHSIPLGDGRRMVVRHYAHGGALRKLTGDRFSKPQRFVDELAVTAKAIAAGVNAPKPLGVVIQKSGPFYKADNLSLEIPDATDMLALAKGNNGLAVLALSVAPIARQVRKLHDAGIFHADLHLKNILFSKDKCYIIDFDAAKDRGTLPAPARRENLFRLLRSVEKFLGREAAEANFPCEELFSEYEGGSQTLGVGFEAFAEEYESHVAPHRKRWEKTGGGYGT
ncbi:MAG: hypothetical protein E3J72_03785 [Planctomycetota bacterium]|nr:MAG: hypothetical protein E3J72_03785 [Planctomycetota bacterium]